MIFRMPNYEDAREASDAAVTRFEGESATRLEFAKETDVLEMIKRHGGVPPNMRQASYMDIDYDVTLSRAFEAVRDARDAFGRLPRDVQDKYSDWAAVMAAAAVGDVEVVDGVPRVAVKRAESPVEQPNRPEEG